MLFSFREELNAPGFNPLGGPTAPANGSAAAPDTSSILKALADMAKVNPGAPTLPQASVPVPAAIGALSPNLLAAMIPQAGTPGMPDSNALGQQPQLLQLLASQGSPQDQWSAAIQIYKMTNQMGSANPDQMPTIPGMPLPGAPAWGAPGAQGRASWDNRSPGGSRRRSRSPGWGRTRRTAAPPRCRDSFVYGDHGASW